jgi:hypothetical protein
MHKGMGMIARGRKTFKVNILKPIVKTPIVINAPNIIQYHIIKRIIRVESLSLLMLSLYESPGTMFPFFLVGMRNGVSNSSLIPALLFRLNKNTTINPLSGQLLTRAIADKNFSRKSPYIYLSTIHKGLFWFRVEFTSTGKNNYPPPLVIR